MSNDSKNACMGIKVSFLALGFKGFKVFKTLCKEYYDFYNWELKLFWKYNTFSKNTLNKIEFVLEQLKAE